MRLLLLVALVFVSSLAAVQAWGIHVTVTTSLASAPAAGGTMATTPPPYSMGPVGVTETTPRSSATGATGAAGAARAHGRPGAGPGGHRALPPAYAAAMQAMRRHRYARAALLFGRVLRRAPRFYRAYQGRALARYELGEYLAAQPDLVTALTHLPSVRETAPNSAYELAGMAGRHRYSRAETLYIGGLESNVLFVDHRAAALFARAHAQDPALVGPYYFLGRSEESTGHLRQAVHDYVAGLTLDPHCSLCLRALGDLYDAAHHYAMALRLYDAAIAADPHLESAWFARSETRHEIGDDRGAYADATHALALDPYDGTAYLNRSTFAADLGRYRQAVRDGDRAVQLLPRVPAAWAVESVAHLYMHDDQVAIAAASRAIALYPAYADAYNDRGQAEEDDGQLEAAQADYGQALALDPTQAIYAANRCAVSVRLAQYQAARLDCDRALRLDPRNARAYLNRGIIRYSLGDRAGARAAWLRALTLYRAQGDGYDARVAQGDLALLDGSAGPVAPTPTALAAV